MIRASQARYPGSNPGWRIKTLINQNCLILNMEEINFKEMEIAYFSMEIGIDANVPTYSGGLGILAGDTLRSEADLELPVIGITFVYNKGYFKQSIDEEGNQHEDERNWKPEEHLEKLPNKVVVKVDGRDVVVGCWLYKLRGVSGKYNPIIFLDTDFPENNEEDRRISHHLYGGDLAYRLTQEIILGIGGVRMLDSLGCNVKKYHMNEGHSALLCLELYRKFNDIDKVRNACVFTTHTPVPAGHDQFDYNLAKNLLSDNLPPELENDIFWEGKLNMTHVGLRFSQYINGVAKKHGEVSRDMFPGYHIESITNGVHSMFWTSEPFKKLFDEYIKNWEADPFSLRYVLGIPLNKIWNAHVESKKKLIDFVNNNYNAQMDENVFTIGFARRAATYKRGDLLFSNIQKLIEISKKAGKIQIIYGGKAHPNDGLGKEVIKTIIAKMKEINNDIKCCYIQDYSIEEGKLMTSGVDLWLNTPLRPKEASGTSGMKAAHNGVPQFSILDGWWIEGHIEGKTGWSIGAHPNVKDKNDNEEDIEDLYNKLEYVILPMYYQHQDEWIEVMRNAIAINGSFFNTHRMVQQYVLNAYFD